MPAYTRHPIYSQLSALTLALSLFALPLAGGEMAPVHILMPLAADLVPLGTGLQSPPHIPFHLPAFATATRIVLGPLSPSKWVPNAHSRRGFHIESLTLDHLGLTVAPSSRAPPLA
jgi:hypothetical protein